MEAMDKRRKDRLIKGIVLNTIVFMGCAAYVSLFILPKYDEINATTTKINGTLADISSLKKDGVDKSSFAALLNRLGRKKEVPDMVFSDSEKLGKVLIKPATAKWDYPSWLVEENTKITALDKEIQQNDAVLGSIIPIFTNSPALDLAGDIGNRITLASFISYVEKDILGKYSLTSYAPLGISNITFPDKKDTPVNIGSFKITLDFKGKNSDILSLVDNLQKSGKLTIRSGKIVADDTAPSSVSAISSPSKDTSLSDLSNLLVEIDALSLESIPEANSRDNKGSMTLEFYVEGMNYQKILVLRSVLSEKFEKLKKSVKEKGGICTKPGNPLCNETITANAVAAIKDLTDNLTSLQSKVDAFKKGDMTIDMNKEMDTLVDVKTSLQTIETIYQKNISVIEKANKRPTTK